MSDTAPAAPAPAIEVLAVTRVFRDPGRGDVHALSGVSFALPHGAFAVVRGPSGGGKTSLLRIVAALDRPTSGDVVLDGIRYSRSSAAELTRVRRRMGLVFQNAPLLPRLPLWENVAYPLIPRGAPRGARREAALSVLERTGIPHLADSLPAALSAGERQRAGLARALVGDPAVVIADEPTAHLDAVSAACIRAVLTEITSSATVLVATHDDDLAAPADVTIHVGG